MFRGNGTRWTLIFLLFCVFGCTTFGQTKKLMTFGQIFKREKPELLRTLPFVHEWVDSQHYLQFENQKLSSVDAKTGELKPALDEALFTGLLPKGIKPEDAFENDASRQRYLYRDESRILCVDTQKKTCIPIVSLEGEKKNPTFSPDGRWVAFTLKNDLYIASTDKEMVKRLTQDGSDTILNGYASWVYMEEILGRELNYRAFWWSLDSRYIGLMRTDESTVPVFPLFQADGIHGTLVNTRYPKPGDPNPHVRVGIVDVSSSKLVWADFPEVGDHYFGKMSWTPDGELVTQWMNRGQDDFHLYAVNPATGTKRCIYSEKQPTWIDWKDILFFLPDKQGFLVENDESGWNHIYHYDMEGKRVCAVTSGNWQVAKLEAYDEKTKTIFFTANRESSTRTDLYRVSLDGRGLKRLTSGPFTHRVLMAPGGKWFLTTYSNLETPPRAALCDCDGKVVRELGDSKTPEFGEYTLAKTELIRVPTPDGYPLPCLITWPINFDEHKKYPVLMYVYGGPGVSIVSENWPRLITNQWLAMEGIIQIAVDHRGSGHFGKAGMALMHRKLGKWEMADYIEVSKWLRSKPFVNSDRIAITGGSYGGYATCMALTFGADYFNYGIAEYSLTDWTLYDSHYTERYMDTPAENPDGYKQGSVFTYLDKYRGLLRIVHGTMDDNVHMQNSIQLIDKMEDKGMHFEFILYPNGRHGWGGPKAKHLRAEELRFYYENLLGKPFPVDRIKF